MTKKPVQLLIALSLCAAAYAAPTSCPQHFAGGAAPEFDNPKLADDTAPLCYEAFAVMHSGVSRTPLWSAEHLSRSRIRDAREMKRRDAFHPEAQLPPSKRAELRDYARSGFDRGHMSPSGDMPTASAQRESFSLANIIPQDPQNNQNLWANIEETTRDLAQRRGELYVITGPIFEGESLQRLNGRVLVPTHVFKAVYDPARRQAAAWVAPNRPGSAYQTVSIAELERRIDIDLFPGLPPEVKQRKMVLPAPESHRSAPSWSSEIKYLLRRILKSVGIAI